jgi:hypothetical protein
LWPRQPLRRLPAWLLLDRLTSPECETGKAPPVSPTVGAATLRSRLEGRHGPGSPSPRAPTVIPPESPGPAGPGAADERRRLRVGSGRPPAALVHPAPVGELGGRWRPLDRGRDTIQLRETPGNLSGSGFETHQHFAPADATKEYGSSWIFEQGLTCTNALRRVQHLGFSLGNCCHSLLLDPDATMRIDLHKRLFLLVTGRGE